MKNGNITFAGSSCQQSEQKPSDQTCLLVKRSKRRQANLKKFDRLSGRLLKVYETLGVLPADFSVANYQSVVSSLRKQLVHKGLPGYVAYSKALFEFTFQYCGESTYVNPVHYISVTRRRKIPRVLFPIVKKFYSTKNSKLIQFLLSVLSIYRSFKGTGKVDRSVLKVIEDDNGGVNAKLASNNVVRARVKRAARVFFKKNDPTNGLQVLRNPSLYTTSSAPSSRVASVPVTEYPRWDPDKKELVQDMERVRLNALQCAESEAWALAQDEKTYTAWVSWCTASDQLDLINLHAECLKQYKHDGVNYPVNKIGFKADKGLKNRPFACVNYWIQLSLGGIHTWGYRVLRSDNANHCFDHRKAFRTAVSRLDGSTLVGCLDERAASDLLSVVPFTWCLEVRFGSKVSDAWTLLMQNLKFYVPKYQFIKWGCGQPLGTKGSWPLYNVVSEIIDSVPMVEATGKILPVEIRVGDDSVFFGKRWIEEIRKLRTSLFGVDYGNGKGIISKTAVEICKQYYIREGEVTPLPVDLIDKAYSDHACFGMLVERISESMSIPYSSSVFNELASITCRSYRSNYKLPVKTYLDNRMALLLFFRSSKEDYDRVVRLISLTMILRSVNETLDTFSVTSPGFHGRVTKALRGKISSRLRSKVQDILTDPNPRLDWNEVRRYVPSPPKWCTNSVIHRRGLAKLVNLSTMSAQEADNFTKEITSEIFSKTGY